MSRLTVSGLASGLDWKTVVEEIIRLERAGVSRLESRRSTVDRQAQAWAEIGSRLTELRSRAQALARPDGWNRLLAHSSDPARVEATAAPGASSGTHEITVVSLAAPHRVVGGVFACPQQALELQGTFEVNGCPVVLESHHTLEDLATLVAGTGVGASVIRVAEGEHHLVLTSPRTGIANAINLSDGPEGVLATLGLLDDQGEANTLVAAADAVFQLNGLTLSRSGNTVEDALPGLTLVLRGAGNEAVRLEIEPDHEEVLAGAASMVAAYNSALRSIRSSASGSEVLLSRLQERLAGLIAMRDESELELWQVGISTAGDRSGELVLDRDRLLAVLRQDPEPVQALVTSRAEALSGFLGSVVRTGDGWVPVRTQSLRERKTALERQIRRAEERLATREKTLQAQFVAMEKLVAGLSRQSNALAVSLTWLSEGRR